ncbi:MAG TPA: mechanosensitive ion channel domain-containing protein [Pseudolysinimonas sp.]|nr:mechanosensitive ion channel domain-containing protein [Pseudolysinimonas sp.]
MTAWNDFVSWLVGFLAGPWGTPLRVLLILVVAFVIRVILQFVIRRVVSRVVNGAKRIQNRDESRDSPVAAVRIVQRTKALGGVLSSAVTTLIVIVTIVLIIANISAAASAAFSLITAALGAGLGFGAQNIVKDVLNGLAMVGEDQLGVGDVVDTGFATGVVEQVGIRITQVRDVNGTLWYVRNGEILRLGNLSQGWARVIIDLAVPYNADVEAVQAAMLETATAMQQDARWKPVVLERPEVWGIESISAEAIVIRLVVKTRAGSKDDVARELRARLKSTLDALGVTMPALNSIVLKNFERGIPTATAQTATKPKSTTKPTPRATANRGAQQARSSK